MKILPAIYYYSVNDSKDLKIIETDSECLDVIADEIATFLNLKNHKEKPVIEIFSLGKKSLGKFRVKTRLVPMHYCVRLEEEEG